jgi:hypothetical protein
MTIFLLLLFANKSKITTWKKWKQKHRFVYKLYGFCCCAYQNKQKIKSSLFFVMLEPCVKVVIFLCLHHYCSESRKIIFQNNFSIITAHKHETNDMFFSYESKKKLTIFFLRWIRFRKCVSFHVLLVIYKIHIILLCIVQLHLR